MGQGVIYLIAAGFVAWRVYRRMRRNIGRQPLRHRRVAFRLGVMSLVTIILIATLFHFSHLALAGFGGGLLIGASLGFVGLRLTKFDTTEEGHFYTPDTRMGVGITLLLTGRILYRFIVPPDFTLIPGHPVRPFSPLTFFLAGITIGYFLVYLTGLLVHTQDKKPLPGAGSV